MKIRCAKKSTPARLSAIASRIGLVGFNLIGSFRDWKIVTGVQPNPSWLFAVLCVTVSFVSDFHVLVAYFANARHVPKHVSGIDKNDRRFHLSQEIQIVHTTQQNPNGIESKKCNPKQDTFLAQQWTGLRYEIGTEGPQY